MRAHSIVVLSIVGCLAAPGALAEGFCESLDVTKDVTRVDEAAGRVVVTGEREWCEENADGDGEKRGTIKYAAVYSFKGKVLRTFREEPPKNGLQVATAVGGKKVEAYKAFEGFLKKGKFVDAQTLRKSPKGCKPKIELSSNKSRKKKFDTSKVTLSLMLQGKPVWSKKLGKTADDAQHAEADLFYVGDRTLLVWSDIAMCDGPPPGAMGKDDGGNCIPRYAPKLLNFKAVGGLKACF